MKAVIFDFNRTLYDPDKGSLMPGVMTLLKELEDNAVPRFLVSYAEGRRELIADLGLEKYFKEVVLTADKSVKDFEYLVNKYSLDPKETFVVGDRIRGEIKYGNQLGMTTIWFKKGVFAAELPVEEDEQPDFIIKDLLQVSEIIK